MRLPHDEAGAGPAVVLLHAGIVDRGMWAEHLQPLADAGFRAIAMDLPGFGEAPVAQGEDAPWNDVLDTIDALAVERATLVGNSYGGAVAQRVAVVAPELVGGLVLISSPADGIEPSPELEAVWEAEESALSDGDVDTAVTAVLDAWLRADSAPELRDRVAAMQRRAFELQSEAQPAGEGADPMHENLSSLERVTAPALVAVGEHDMADFHASAIALEDALPDAQRVVIPRARHLAPLEQPERVRELLLSFMR
jgi:pimeloyl-ACP methyl ester carboxylesterase